ncbi:DEAD/DEAH box helicase [Candidatus Enterococcus mangumiae]|uniref:Competence protein ComFA n=1 Tax=Candidatus Enterococcus mangumiae TaxID=2230878 RepID=A0ABZ2SS45_9ENTE|nr:DEAD/DEAH box helicase [Enterococcus sp. DIV1094]MBO0488834.1 DEAD/DEAH box helicase family protein [Enterococcus sp. DIV1094]
MQVEDFHGRRLLSREVDGNEHYFTESKYKVVDAVTLKRKQVYCNRCSQRTPLQEAKINESCYYCPHCLLLGRCDNLQQLYLFEQPKGQERRVKYCWEGQLTVLQQRISSELSEQSGQHLVWAVTGSGKTEMLYESIRKTLEKGNRVAIASPRIDVCQELYLRLVNVFPEETIGLLHGKAKEPYRYSSVVICTTHQLYRFYQAFALLVVDEVDAFPFVGDLGLNYAVRTALQPSGKLIYLSATPDDRLLKKSRTTMAIHQLALRFHQRLLPEPSLLFWNKWASRCLHPRKNRPLRRLIHELIKENHVLLFCPSIQLMEQLENQLKNQLSCRIVSASSKDERRSQKVQSMREQQYDLFLTTMILERGVTFERISVIVLGADHPVFSKSSLVQIAGRADRKGGFTNSQVYFLYEEKTLAIAKACKEIKQMNRKGKAQRDEMRLL